MKLNGKYIWLCFLLFKGAVAFCGFSDEAWKKIEKTFDEILVHPFNQELGLGMLAPEKFAFYQKQDAYYLHKFSQALRVLAQKLENPLDKEFVSQLARDSLEETTTTSKLDPFEITPSNLSYTHFLLATGAFGTREELASALLPCYWIYAELAKALKEKSNELNPYWSWIEMYSSSAYEQDVLGFRDLVNRLAQKTTPEVVVQMHLAFMTAAQLELYFWDDAYKLRKFFGP